MDYSAGKSFRSVLTDIVNNRWPNHKVWVDCYTVLTSDWSKNTEVYVRLAPPLIRGQKAKPVISYKTKFNWRADNAKVACIQKVITALTLLEEGHAAEEVEPG